MLDIITNKMSPPPPCEYINYLEEAKVITDRSFIILSRYPLGKGLAANQVGITKAICIANIFRPIWLANSPFVYCKILEKFIFQEVTAMKKKGTNERITMYENEELELTEIVILFQELIDTGFVWKLQGHYGHIAGELIEAGLCNMYPVCEDDIPIPVELH
jgi:hypothetical protein